MQDDYGTAGHVCDFTTIIKGNKTINTDQTLL